MTEKLRKYWGAKDGNIFTRMHFIIMCEMCKGISANAEGPHMGYSYMTLKTMYTQREKLILSSILISI